LRRTKERVSFASARARALAHPAILRLLCACCGLPCALRSGSREPRRARILTSLAQFRASRDEADPAKVAALYEQGLRDLEVVARQAQLSQMYFQGGFIVESRKKPHFGEQASGPAASGSSGGGDRSGGGRSGGGNGGGSRPAGKAPT
jgi:uncharacterized membrane protein YgcG